MILSGKTYYVELNGQKFLKLLFWKIVAAIGRAIDVFRLLPLRLIRLFKHFIKGLQGCNALFNRAEVLLAARQQLPVFAWWWLEFTFLLLDCLGITEVYETLMDFSKYNSRPLHNWERKLAREIFGNSINYSRVRIDEFALAGPRQYQFCYVSFYTINSWGSMNNSLLLHEMTHVWQYEQLGAVYIPRALRAQRLPMGYNYGGLDQLEEAQQKGKLLQQFNLEQQADVVADYYRIKEGYMPQWGNARKTDLGVYEHFINQINKK